MTASVSPEVIDDKCSAYIRGGKGEPSTCKNGFPLSSTCSGKAQCLLVPHCMNEKWLDNPKHSAWCMDDSGKPKEMAKQQPAGQEKIC